MPGLGDVVKPGGEGAKALGGLANDGHVVGVEKDLDEFVDFTLAIWSHVDHQRCI